MIFVELALQGARGFPALVRMGLKSGLNVWRCPDPALRAALVDAAYHTLFPDPSRGSATSHLSQAEACKIALTFFGRDKLTYRVLRDATNGATKLYKFDAAQNQYQLFTNVAQEVTQYLRVQQRIPDEVGYERLFMFSPATMPSKGPKARSRSGALIAAGRTDRAPSGPGMPGMDSGMFGAPPRMMSSTSGGATPPPRSTSGFGSSLNMNNALVLSELEGSIDLGIEPEPEGIEGKKQQLIDLRKEYQVTLRAEQAQTELDQLNARKFDLTEKTERLKKIEAERQRLLELFQKEDSLRSLPIGFAQRIEKFEELEKKHELERNRAHEELSSIDEQERSFQVDGLERDPYFLGGLAGAAVMLSIAVMYSLPALAWINVLSMVVAAGGAFRYVGELEKKHRLGIRLRGARERLERIERQYLDDTRSAKELMRRLEIDSPQELLERVRGFEKLQGQIRVAEDAIRSLMADPEIARARAEVDQIQGRVQELEAAVLGTTSVVSTDALAKRIRALEVELGPDAPPPEVVRAPPRRNTSYSFFPPPETVPRADSFNSADLPLVPPPFTESGQAAPADPRMRAPSGSGHRRPPALSLDDDEDGYGSGYGGTKGPSRGGGAGFSAAGGLYAIGYGGPPGMLGGGGLGGYGGGGYGDDPAAAQGPDRSRDLFQIAVDLLAVDVDDLAQRIRTRLGQYLTAFSDKQFREGSFGPRGELSVIGADGEPLPYMELPPQSIDMVDSALRFTLIEACLTEVRVPVIFDDPFGEFSPKKRKLLGQMLGYLAQSTQVLVLTDKSDIAGREVQI